MVKRNTQSRRNHRRMRRGGMTPIPKTDISKTVKKARWESPIHGQSPHISRGLTQAEQTMQVIGQYPTPYNYQTIGVQTPISRTGTRRFDLMPQKSKEEWPEDTYKKNKLPMVDKYGKLMVWHGMGHKRKSRRRRH